MSTTYPLSFSVLNVLDYELPEEDHWLRSEEFIYPRGPPCLGPEFVSRNMAYRGQLLTGQCRARNGDGDRCSSATEYDYRFCRRHLLTRLKLVVAKSRLCVPGAGHGLFAADPATVYSYGLTTKTRRPHPHKVKVFEAGEWIDQFGGEALSCKETVDRYGENASPDYVLLVQGDDGTPFPDGLVARTAAYMANDALNPFNLTYPRVACPKSYRARARYREAHASWPHLMNAQIEYNPKLKRFGLRALVPIYHGEEILVSYSGRPDNCRDKDGTWKSPIDVYWYDRLDASKSKNYL